MADITLSYSHLRANLSEVMTEVTRDKITAHITRKNGENCVLLPEEEYSSIMETLYLFGNPANAKHLEKSIEQAQLGEVVKVNI